VRKIQRSITARLLPYINAIKLVKRRKPREELYQENVIMHLIVSSDYNRRTLWPTSSAVISHNLSIDRQTVLQNQLYVRCSQALLVCFGILSSDPLLQHLPLRVIPGLQVSISTRDKSIYGHYSGPLNADSIRPLFSRLFATTYEFPHLRHYSSHSSLRPHARTSSAFLQTTVAA
jgi:hypothetical protein